MVRISGINIPLQQQVEVGLTNIYGVGRSIARKICLSCNISPLKKIRDLNDLDLERIREQISNLLIEGDLRRDLSINIKRLIDIGCYRGFRHRRGLPVHGQRTRTNARTRKGPRRSAQILKK